MNANTVNTQDWTPVVIKKNQKINTKKPAEINRAIQQGAVVETVKKYKAGGNKNILNNNNINFAKLEQEDKTPKIKHVSHDLAQKIQQGRLAKKMTRKDLAQRLNVKESVIAEYETGKAIPNGQLLARIRSILAAETPSPTTP